MLQRFVCTFLVDLHETGEITRKLVKPVILVYLCPPIQKPNVHRHSYLSSLQPRPRVKTRKPGASQEYEATFAISRGQSKEITFFFFFISTATYEHTLLHIVTLYINITCTPCLPLSPCTDNDCIWSHSFIFYIIIGALFCFWDCLINFVLLL